MVSTETTVYQSKFRRALAIIVTAIGSIVIVWGLIADARGSWRLLAPMLLAVALAYVLFWRPSVTVTPAGVEIGNPLRTVELPWPSIRSVDTRYALTLVTAHGQYSAWAAPAPTRSSAMLAQRSSNRDVRKGRADGTQSISPGDLVTSPSGAAAHLIRSRYDELRKAGLLDNPQLERERPRVSWHWPEIAVVATLLVATTLSIILA